MKKHILFVLSILTLDLMVINSSKAGNSFGGSFAGGLTGSFVGASLGNAATAPRQRNYYYYGNNDESVYTQAMDDGYDQPRQRRKQSSNDRSMHMELEKTRAALEECRRALGNCHNGSSIRSTPAQKARIDFEGEPTAIEKDRYY